MSRTASSTLRRRDRAAAYAELVTEHSAREDARLAATQGVSSHVAQFFAGHSIRELPISDEHLRQRIPGLVVYEVAPGPRVKFWSYVTNGCWDGYRQPTGSGLEFAFATQEPSERAVEVLTINSYYNAGPPSQHLHVGDTTYFGEPVLAESLCDHLLISLPYPWGPDFEEAEWATGEATFAWLMPITAGERDFKAEHGLDALEELFERTAVKALDPKRRSVV